MKLTTAWMKANYFVAVAGIDAAADKFEKETLEQFLRENKELFPKAKDGILYSYENLFFGKALTIITSVGCGKHKDTWDASNWSSVDATPEQEAKWIELDLENKVKAFKQELTANNEVIQKVMAAQPALEKKYFAALRKVSKAEDKSGMSAGEWFDDAGSHYEDCPQAATIELFDEHVASNGIVLWHELVDLYKEIADYTAEALLDNME